MTIVPRIAALFVSVTIVIVHSAAAQTTLLPFTAGVLSGNGRFVVYDLASRP
jgi:hypothetical protein